MSKGSLKKFSWLRPVTGAAALAGLALAATAVSAAAAVRPAVPSGFRAAASPTTTAPVLRWDAGAAGLQYRVTRDGVVVGRVSTTSFTDAAAGAGVHRYKLRAVTSAGVLSYPAGPVYVDYRPGSTDAAATVGAPTGLTAAALSTSTAPVLSWTAPAARGAGGLQYTVYRNGSPVANVATTSFTDLALSTAGSHTYTVRAYDTAGTRSAASNAVTVTFSTGTATSSLVGVFPKTTNGIHLLAAPEMWATPLPSLAVAQSLAREHDVVHLTPGQARGGVSAAMRSANPDIVIVMYQNGMFGQSSWGTRFPSSWYMKSKSGAKIASKGYGNWLMDPRSTAPYTASGVTYNGWSDWVAKNCKKYMDYVGAGAFDSCFLDMLGTAPLDPGYNEGGLTPWDHTTNTAFTPQEWIKLTSTVGAKVEAYLKKPVLGNGLGNGPRFYNMGTRSLYGHVTAGQAEIWMRTPLQSLTRYPNLTEWKQNVQMLTDTAKSPNIATVTVKTWTTGTTAQKEAWRKFGLASYLLGNAGHSYFEFTSDRKVMPWNDVSPLYHLNIGTPVESYASVDAYLQGGVYQRDFTSGKVLVNPGDSAVSVPLGGTYRTPAGAAVTQVTVPAHGAELLTR